VRPPRPSFTQGRAAEAMAALEAAVAVNFGIREAPLYHVVQAQVGEGEYQAS
jgi:hypothetical protein